VTGREHAATLGRTILTPKKIAIRKSLSCPFRKIHPA